MKAIVLEQAGNADNLHFKEMPTPTIGDNEVLVKTRSISINPVDIKTRKGQSVYNDLKAHNATIILGWDISGTVVEVGNDVKKFRRGDDVFGMINFPGHGKAYAEYVAAPATELALKPKNISHDEAAAATLAALTAWQAVVTHGKVSKGQKVVIQAAAGGVGHYAVQIAKYLGAYVIASSSEANKEFVLGLGADEHVDYRKQALNEVVNDADFVLDPVGGENIDPSLKAVKKGGTVIMLPSIYKEQIVEKAKARGVNGYYFSVRPNENDLQQIATLLEKGIIRSHVSQTFAFEQMREAHQQIETGRTRGKVIVIV